MKAPLTPHKNKGAPWNNKTKSKIKKGTTKYKSWKKAEKALLAKQLSIAAHVVSVHGMHPMGVRLAGRGDKGKRRLPELLEAFSSLSDSEKRMYVIPTVGTWHPCCGLASKWFLPPKRHVITEYALAFRNALEGTGMDVSRTTVEDFKLIITRQMNDYDVSFLIYV